MTEQLPLFDPIEIPLTQGYVALVDLCDLDLADLSWYAMKGGTQGRTQTKFYAVRKPRAQKAILMHRVILSRILDRALLPREQCDHINADSLDNRRCNLRVATNSENARNRSAQSNSTTGLKGVVFDKRWNKYYARIGVHGKYQHLGCFDSPEAAHTAYCEAAAKFHGEFARTE